MATSISFTYGATALTFRPAEFSDTRDVTRVQVRARTHDGLLLVGDKDLTIVRFSLAWKALTDSERASLEAFFGPAVVNGSLNTFEYLDHFGIVNHVRLIDDTLSYANDFTDLWSVSMQLEQVAVGAES
jgi:hypothetical protein